ncbi:mucin-6-like [Arapaima gigas]
MPSALVPSKTQSSSPTSAVGSSSQTGCSPSPDDPDCADPTTSISGNTDCCQPVADSPSTSTSHYDRTVKPDTNPKKVLHKLSPHHDVLNQDDSSQSASPSVETPTKSTSPVSASVCPEETLKSSRDSPSLDPQFLPASNTHDEIFAPDESHYPVCSTPPSTAIFPSNHPKNFTLSSTCPRRILYCQFCPRAFYYLSDLERHSITHSQSKPHVCPLCSKAFKRSSHLERHKHIHTGQRNFICPICSKRFREAGELLRHQRVHTGEKPFQCPLCHMRFAERNTLRRHTKRKHQEPSGQTDTHARRLEPSSRQPSAQLNLRGELGTKQR